MFLTSDQRRRLLEHAKGAFLDLAQAALLAGARYGELRELTAGDFDCRRKTLSIRKGKTGARSVPLSDAGTSVRMIEEHYGKLLPDDARERLNAIAFA